MTRLRHQVIDTRRTQIVAAFLLLADAMKWAENANKFSTKKDAFVVESLPPN